MKEYSPSEIAEITNGAIVRQGTDGLPVRRVVTDSRNIASGDLFVALTGEKYNGHDFVADAIAGGCKMICVRDSGKLPEGDYTVVLVDDTLNAYQKIAARARQDSTYKVIAVTGSVGKTSTREFIASALSEGAVVHKTSQNFNNEIGLPKTLIETPDNADFCVVELAMRAEGQIRELTLIARPDIAVITNIGLAHVGILGSREAIFRAKTEIVEGLKPGGLVVLNCDDPMLRRYAGKISGKYNTAVVYTGVMKDDLNASVIVRGYDIRSGADHTLFSAEVYLNGRSFSMNDLRIPAPGAHNASNALLGIAAAVWSGADPDGIRKGFGTYLAVGNRQRIINRNGITIIDDTYNAGPESMKAAINLLVSGNNKHRKIAVLGGMLELGDHSRKAHNDIGKFCAEKSIDLIFVQTPEGQWYKDGFLTADHSAEASIRLFSCRDELINDLENELCSGDKVLIKGSRGFKMEEITARLVNNKE